MTDIQKQLAEALELWLSPDCISPDDRTRRVIASHAALAAHRQQEERGPLTDERMEMIADEAIKQVPDSNPVGRICYAIRAALAFVQVPGNGSIELPDFWECSAKVGQGCASPLEQFIYDNEPAEDGEAEQFRTSLSQLLAAHGIKGE